MKSLRSYRKLPRKVTASRKLGLANDMGPETETEIDLLQAAVLMPCQARPQRVDIFVLRGEPNCRVKGPGTISSEET